MYETEPPTAAARPLLTHPRVLCTPHLGASTEEAQRKVAREIAQQMSDAFQSRGFVGVVNAAHLGLLAARPALAPYVRLAEALGSLQAQVCAWGGWEGRWAGAQRRTCPLPPSYLLPPLLFFPLPLSALLPRPPRARAPGSLARPPLRTRCT